MIHRFTFLAIFLAFSMLVYVEVQAQAVQLVKPFTGTVNKAVSSTLSKRLKSMGFAANDPIYGATMATAQNVVGLAVVGGSVAATVAAVGSAPVWLSIALGLGAAYEVYDFTMGSKTWKPEPSYKVVQMPLGTYVKASPAPQIIQPSDLTTLPVLANDYANPGIGNALAYPSDQPVCALVSMSFISMQYHATVYGSLANLRSATVCGSDEVQVTAMALNQYIYISNKVYNDPSIGNGSQVGTGTLLARTPLSSSGPTKIACTINAYTCPNGVQYSFTRVFTDQSHNVWPGVNPVIYTSNNTVTFTMFNNPAYIKSTSATSVNDAAAQLTQYDLLSLADPQLIAAIANKIWQKASEQPDYVGAPYNPSNPITAQHVIDDIAAGLYPHPTVQDLLSPATATPTTEPVFDPAAETVSPAAPGAAQLDLGPNPGISTPGLEEAPTGESIVSFIMGKLPAFSAFQIPVHESACVVPSMEFYGQTYSFQSMCDLAEQQRALLASIFLALWGITSLAIVLKA
ncbi:MAG: hypothetical protein Q8K12_17585 [Thiobacillus sp.]|nr:hypothetical protein [Thiobacillus sp.]